MSIKLIQRSFFYFQKGYSTYLSLPLALTSFATTVYYLAIRNLPFLTHIFPNFHNFIIILPLVYPIGVGIGWLHYRKSRQFEHEQEIMIISNPYSTIKIAPVSLPAYTLYAYLARKEGLNELADKFEAILRRSQT